MSISTAIVTVLAGAFGLVVAACATGGPSMGDGTVDAASGKDSSTVAIDANLSVIDAPVSVPDGFVPQPDSFVPPDAFIPPAPDAPPSGPFCTANNQCTTSGECCLIITDGQGLCAPGTVVLGTCFPIT